VPVLDAAVCAPDPEDDDDNDADCKLSRGMAVSAVLVLPSTRFPLKSCSSSISSISSLLILEYPLEGASLGRLESSEEGLFITVLWEAELSS